ncbi:MAG: hypothetical protein J5719_03160 [Bacteroidales bacterium]|nr:hypothetical protein [Bacteroidales bacterium]
MDNFDQLLKEKIEQKQYAYKASAWRKFARQSGIGTSVGALKIAAISLVTVGLLSTGGYLAYKYLSPKPVDETTQVMAEPSEEPTIVAEDTIQIADAELNSKSDEFICDFGVTPEEMKRLEEREAKQNATTSEKPAQQSATQTEEPKKPIERDDNWRVVIINPDTIGPEN